MQNSNSRIKKLNNEKQPLERRNKTVSNNSDQVTDNPRTSQENNTNNNNEPSNIDQPNDIASQNNNSNVDEIAPQKKPRISFYTLRNNVVDTSFSDRSRRNAVSKSDYKKLQIQYLTSKNEALKLRLNAVEKNLNNTDHRREHSDDHYRHDIKRASKLEKFKMQPVINYNNLIN